MKRLAFFFVSTLFHAALIYIAMLIPPVFVSEDYSPADAFTYVELAGPEETGPELPPDMTAEDKTEPETTEPVPEKAVPPPAPKPAPKPAVKPVPPKPEPKPAPKPAPADKPKPPETTPAPKRAETQSPDDVVDVEYDSRRMRPFERVEPAPVPREAEGRPPEPAGRKAEAPAAPPPDKPAAPARPVSEPAKPAPSVRPKPVPAPVVKPKEAELPKRVEAIRSSRNAVSFMHRVGWPDPPMLSIEVEMPPGTAQMLWRADADQDWIIVTPGSGVGPATLRVGVAASLLGPGYRSGSLTVRPASPGFEPSSIEVSVMVLPENKSAAYLPHTEWDDYVNGDCKVCHLPQDAMPSKDYLEKPEFCELCHTKNGIASGVLAGMGGHPVGVKAGSGGTTVPSAGTIPEGMYSDDLSTHLPGGKVVCITCHNVMHKPGDLGRGWELCSPEPDGSFRAEMGGWSNMGCIEPKVYVMDSLVKRPDSFGELKKKRLPQDGFTYDPEYGTVKPAKAPGKAQLVYVTLTEPYLRMTTRNDALCFGCHNQATHMGLGCLTCHGMHGTSNLAAVSEKVHIGGGRRAPVRYAARTGKGSFADGDAVRDGICEVCHTKTAYHSSSSGSGGSDSHHAGGDCTACHSHSAGFGR